MNQSYTFSRLVAQTLTWKILDMSNQPVTGATVKATLYADRSIDNPTQVPGTADPVFNNITLTETPSSSGIYIGTIPAAFNPPQASINFVLHVDAGSVGSWDVWAVVLPTSSAIDLTTVDRVKSWLSNNGTPSTSTSDDANIQLCITAASNYWLQKTGRDYGVPEGVSSLASIATVDEWKDGNGNDRLFLSHFPVLDVVSLEINGSAVPASSGFNSPGWVIDSTQKCLVMRGGWGNAVRLARTVFQAGGGFARGVMNVHVQYKAGFSIVPSDVELACTQMVAVNYKRKNWIDQASQAMAAGAGTISYRSWELPPEVVTVIDFYSRVSF